MRRVRLHGPVAAAAAAGVAANVDSLIVTTTASQSVVMGIDEVERRLQSITCLSSRSGSIDKEAVFKIENVTMYHQEVHASCRGQVLV